LIFVYHNNSNVVTVESEANKPIVFDSKLTIAATLYDLARQFVSEKIVWCHCDYKEILNKDELLTLFHQDKLVLSYRPDTYNYFGNIMGYVDETLFINVNKKVCFPTWQMSNAVGIVHASVLTVFKTSVPFDADFDFYLNSLAKLGITEGLLCYSEPRLFKKKLVEYKEKKATITTVFKFVKQHYRKRWVFLLLFNLMIYEQKFPVLPFILSFFYKNRTKINIDLDVIKVQSSRKVIDKGTVDVIIPTIGRKAYLYDVLLDLKKQTHLPEKVIIVEQNPVPNTVSELDYLQSEEWPFEINHIFTHQAGACNARNVALAEVRSEWVFLADDDIRFESNLIQNTLKALNKFGVKAVSLRCFQNRENKKLNNIFQWGAFGSGCSFVFSDSLNDCKFKTGYEFGFGEDGDFGMQLRNQGYDVLYLPEPEILHLKAPMGGFRTKPVLQWHNDPIQPKPSPTVMLYQITNNTKEQISGYKTILFFKYYKFQKIKNPLKYYFNFQKQWGRSVFWANELKKQ